VTGIHLCPCRDTEEEDSEEEDTKMDVSTSSESVSDEEVDNKEKNSMEVDTTRKSSLVESKLHKFSEIGKNEKLFAWMDGS